MHRSSFAVSVLLVSLSFLPANRASAAITFIDFETGVGVLTEQNPAGALTASGDRAVFSELSTIVAEFDGSRIEVANPNLVSIKMILRPDSDANNTVTMFIADRDDLGIFITGAIGPSSTLLTDWIGNTDSSVGIPFPFAFNNEFTLTYNVGTEEATWSRLISGGGLTTVSLPAALNGALNVILGVQCGGTGGFEDLTLQGIAVPTFPGVFDADNPFVNFAAKTPGIGSEPSPFDNLTEGIGTVNPGGTVSIEPGSTSDTPTISNALSLANNDSVGGSVTIGSVARSARSQSDRSGFVSGPEVDDSQSLDLLSESLQQRSLAFLASIAEEAAQAASSEDGSPGE